MLLANIMARSCVRWISSVLFSLILMKGTLSVDVVSPFVTSSTTGLMDSNHGSTMLAYSLRGGSWSPVNIVLRYLICVSLSLAAQMTLCMLVDFWSSRYLLLE